MIRGIGPVYAKKLVRAFDSRVFDVIETAPERLREIAGIGPVRAGRITEAWAEQRWCARSWCSCTATAWGPRARVRIFKTYGADAVEVMSENPYRLARDIRGIGFKTADAIAMRLGNRENGHHPGPRRRWSCADRGHGRGPLRPALRGASAPGGVASGNARGSRPLGCREGAGRGQRRPPIGSAIRPCIFLAGLYGAERGIAGRLGRIAAGSLPWPRIDPDRAVPWIEERIGLTLAPSQSAAGPAGPLVQGAGRHRRPRRRQDHHRQRHPAHPGRQGRQPRPLRTHGTGRAAHDRGIGIRGTHHPPLLEVDPASGGFRRDADRPVDCDLLVVDEASMVDVC